MASPNFTTLFVCLLAGAAGLLSFAARAAAAEDMEWQFFQTPDGGYKSTRLIYGVPDTAAGADAEKEAFENAKDLGTIEAWEAFIANYPSGFHADLARAYIKKLGSSEAATDAAPSAPEPLNAASESTPDPSCKERTKLRSKNSDTKTKITFVNKSGGMRGILWLDFTGQPKDYANLQNGEEAVFDTFMTRPWMITDGPGNCLQIVMPHPGARVVELTGAAKAVQNPVGCAGRLSGRRTRGEVGCSQKRNGPRTGPWAAS
jgi:hypothetical protein